MDGTGDVSLVISAAAGVATFFSPCLLPLVPAYLSFITGYSLDRLTGERVPLAGTFLSALAFVLGFTAVFVALGASATYFGAVLLRNQTVLRYVGGGLVVLFGIHLTGLLRIPLLYREKRFHLPSRVPGLLGAFIVGAVFAIGWTPCVGPALATMLVLASQQGTVARGMLLLACYSLGIGIPFLLLSLAVNRVLGVLNRTKRHYRTVEIVSGLLLVAAGILILTDRLLLFR